MFKKKEKPLDSIHLTHLTRWKDDWTWSPTRQGWHSSLPVTGCATSAGDWPFLRLHCLTYRGGPLLPLRDLGRIGQLSEIMDVEALGIMSGIWWALHKFSLLY